MLDIILVKCRCYTQNKSKKKYPQMHYNVHSGIISELPWIAQ